MTTLYKRATPAQERVLRIVEGAVHNEADVHGRQRDERMARSIAKRAAGTLTAQWPEVLAANERPPEQAPASGLSCRACERRAQLTKLRARRQRGPSAKPRAGRGASHLLRRPPLRELWERLKREMWGVKRAADPWRFEAYRDVLRMIDKLEHEIAAAQIDQEEAMTDKKLLRQVEGKNHDHKPEQRKRVKFIPAVCAHGVRMDKPCDRCAEDAPDDVFNGNHGFG